jgi:hypothetical protein
VCLLWGASVLAAAPPDVAGALTEQDLEDLLRLKPPPRLQVVAGRKTLELKGDARTLFEQTARAFGLDCVFDYEYQPGPTLRIRLEETDYREALHQLELATGSFVVPVSERLFLVAKDSPQKRAQVEPTVAVAIRIPDPATVQEAQELARTIQQAMEVINSLWHRDTQHVRERFMYCANCGHNLADDVTFCINCGAPASQAASDSRSGGRPEVAPTAMKVGTSPQNTRRCEWCAEVIPEAAVRCPKCQKWRKDIAEDRVKAYVWSLVAMIPAVSFLAGVREGRWSRFDPVLGPFGKTFSFEAFVSSPGGLVILAAFSLSLLLSLRYTARVSRKIGSWWWF